MPFEQDGVSVVVTPLQHTHLCCARCRRYLTCVDRDPVFAMVCDRCSSVMHTLHYDITHRHTSSLPHGLVNMTAETFTEQFVREEVRHLSLPEMMALPQREPRKVLKKQDDSDG